MLMKNMMYSHNVHTKQSGERCPGGNRIDVTMSATDNGTT